jgi:membrane-associated phospholipid phosphatase
LQLLDHATANYWHEHDRQTGFWWEIMVQLTDLGGISSIAILTGMGALWQWSAGHHRYALVWISIAMGSGLIEFSLKEAIGRARPSPELRDRAVLQESRSYPSGHCMGSTVGYGMLAYTLRRRGPVRRERRWIAATFLILLIAGIGLSRVFLRAHWLSDVIGGYLFGITWLCGCLGVLEKKRRPLVVVQAPAPSALAATP